MATGPIETHLHRSFNWENGAPGPQEGPRGRSANCGNGLFAQCVRLRSEINLIKQMADVADDVAVFVNACGTKIARGAKANDEIVEADRRCGSVVCKCRSWANAQCRGFGQACKWRQRRESKAQRECSTADGVVFGHNFSIRRVRLCDSFGHYTAQMFKDAGLIVCAAQ